MPKKRLGILAVLAVIVLGALLAGCGGSSDHSSEWESPDEASLRMNLEYEAPELSTDQVDCMVEKTKGDFPPSIAEQIDNNEQPSSEQQEKIEEISKECVGVSSDSESSESSTELPESVVGGPACQEDLTSSACAEEEQEKIESAQEEEMEIYEE